jgi:hypothetical protein
MQGFGSKIRRKGPLGRPRRRWDDNLKVGLKKVGWEGVDWIYMAEDSAK